MPTRRSPSDNTLHPIPIRGVLPSQARRRLAGKRTTALCAVGLGIAFAGGCRLCPPNSWLAYETSHEAAGSALLAPADRAWRLFFEINRQALSGHAGIPDPRFCDLRRYEDDRDVVWETWARASADENFASEVFPDCGVPVLWNELPRPEPQTADRLTDLSEPRCAAIVPRYGQRSDEFMRQEFGHEVRLNRAAYDYVVSHALYVREQLRNLYAEAASTGNADIVSFPMGAMTIKAQWTKSFRPQDQSRYHWRTIGDEKLALVGLHIVSKDLPYWYWSTFVHVDQPGLPDPVRRQRPRPELVGTKWEHFRLIGTQVAFTDARGVRTLLGNPEIEPDARRSSCITCHAYARTRPNGLSGGLDGLQLDGAPNPAEYWEKPLETKGLKALPTDFVWVVPGNSREDSPTTAPSGP